MVKVENLTDIGDKDYEKRLGEYMLCQDCGKQWGGTRGDYWNCPKDHIFTCPECNSDNIALVDITTQKIIKE